MYIVVCQYIDGVWGIALPFGLPWASDTYLGAVELKAAIIEDRRDTAWTKKNFAIAKITL